MTLKTLTAALAAAVLAVGMTACNRDNTAGSGSSTSQDQQKRSGSAAGGSSGGGTGAGSGSQSGAGSSSAAGGSAGGSSGSK